MLVGFSNTFYLTQVSTFLQQKVPDQLRGRVMSLYALCWNLLPLGGLLAGVLAAAVDARFAVLVGGVHGRRQRPAPALLGPAACDRAPARAERGHLTRAVLEFLRQDALLLSKTDQ